MNLINADSVSFGFDKEVNGRGIPIEYPSHLTLGKHSQSVEFIQVQTALQGYKEGIMVSTSDL
jgi:hypothetical protein